MLPELQGAGEADQKRRGKCFPDKGKGFFEKSVPLKKGKPYLERVKR